MGRQHVDYGVADFMYPWVKECLLATLEEIGAEDWRPAYAQAWSHALDAIAAQMLEGAAQRRAEDARAERKSKSR
jgi:hemoglobin-like flavoprotein